MDIEHEKGQSAVGNDSPTDAHGDMKNIVQTKGNNIGEAADVYGDLATAEQFGYVERGYVFSPRAWLVFPMPLVQS
jgi:amino acid transporter